MAAHAREKQRLCSLLLNFLSKNNVSCMKYNYSCKNDLYQYTIEKKLLPQSRMIFLAVYNETCVMEFLTV